MPRHSSFHLEKSPVEYGDYEGLQLDTRAKENREKHIRGSRPQSRPQGFVNTDYDHGGTYVDEKSGQGTVVNEFSPSSPDSTVRSGLSPTSPDSPSKMGNIPSSPSTTTATRVPAGRRVCGLRRRHFWELFGLLLAIIIAAAVIGGVVGGLQTHGGSSPHKATPQPPTNTTSKSFSPLLPGDVQIGSPLVVVTYDEGPPESFEARQAFRIYFQSALGNIKEVISYHLEPWQTALPIFTDAINNTGLATVTYLNDTSQQGSIFYVGDNGLLQEKRKIYNNTAAYWEPGTLNNLNLPMVGNISLPPGDKDDVENTWDSYRMAAVYSTNFYTGPGIRLFYHSQELNGSTFVQEMIWIQANDSWLEGAKLSNVWPNSHMAATLDNSTNILRLFFSSGSNTLQEMWLPITDPNAEYTPGLSVENFLAHDNSDIAATTVNGTTYLYRYSFANQTAQPGIHELTISGTPGAVNNQEAYNVSSPLVSSPELTVNGEVSLYQPLAVSNTAVPGLKPQIYVFWADMISGDPATSASGYQELAEISRSMSNSTWPTSGQLQIPLGDNNSQPS